MKRILRTIDGLYVTQSISVPRSGHHWLAAILKDYFGEPFHYCEMYEQPELRIERCRATNYQKNHDFDLTTRIRFDHRYVVQIRSMTQAIASRWFSETQKGHITDTSLKNWMRMTRSWVDYYSRFMQKWVYSDIPNRMVLRQTDAERDPMQYVGKVVRFIAVSGECDLGKLSACIAAHPFYHYNYPLFHPEIDEPQRNNCLVQ